MTPTDERRADAIADLEAEIARIEDLMVDAPSYLVAMFAEDRALCVRLRDELEVAA